MSIEKLKNIKPFASINGKLPDVLYLAEKLAVFGFWEWNIKTEKVIWSDHLYSLFGRDKKNFEPSFETFMEVIHDKDKEHVIKKINETIEKKQL